MRDRVIKVLNVLIILVTLVCLYSISSSIYHIFVWKQDGDSINKLSDDLLDITDVKEIPVEDEDNRNVEVVKPDEEIPESDPYWAYVNMNMIDVDFYDLKDVNKEVAGWIQVNGTNINYPFVQTKDNKYYLTHAFDKSKNSAGWVFLDYRNKSDLTDKNNIIYAHGRYDNTMFGSLRNALTNGWLNNKNNFIIKIATPYQNSLWQVFSIYHIPTTSDYLRINFADDQDFSNFTNMLIKRSAYKFNTKVSPSDKILTLSTCYNDTEKLVLHAKLIKYENKTN